jgi:hypothetical protein
MNGFGLLAVNLTISRKSEIILATSMTILTFGTYAHCTKKHVIVSSGLADKIA